MTFSNHRIQLWSITFFNCRRNRLRESNSTESNDEKFATPPTNKSADDHVFVKPSDVKPQNKINEDEDKKKVTESSVSGKFPLGIEKNFFID